jgi:hypothetical protein
MLVVQPPKLNSKSMKSFEIAGVATAWRAGEDDTAGVSSAAASRPKETRQPYVDDTAAGTRWLLATAEVMAGGKVGASTDGIARGSVSRSQSSHSRSGVPDYGDGTNLAERDRSGSE